jgi:protein arginine N-methyltransferase 1
MILIPNYCQHPYYWDAGLHLLYVGDRLRLDPFREAIGEIVRPGMVVADIGTGTGPLARFAAHAGASKVYGVEQYQEILWFAGRLNRTERLDQIIDLIPGDSREVALPERVDVIVAELIGALGNDEAMSGILEDARHRCLKPGGKIIPSHVEVFICPISAPEAHAQIATVYHGDPIVPPAAAFPPFEIYYAIVDLPFERLLSREQTLDSINLMEHTELGYQRSFSFACEREGTFSGFAVWFKAALTGSVMLDTSPTAETTCWGQAFFPVREQVAVRGSDVIDVVFSAIVPSGSDRPFYRWHGSVRRESQILCQFRQASRLPTITKPGARIPGAAKRHGLSGAL